MKNTRVLQKTNWLYWKAIKPVVASDKRLGYHSEAHAYMFNEEMIQEKIEELKAQSLKMKA